MKRYFALLALLPCLAWADAPQVTIYNDGFATVKENRILNLEEGVQEVRLDDMTRQLEPDSVMLRELSDQPAGIQILEQSFVNDPLTESLMLHQMEGKVVRFDEVRSDGSVREHHAKIIRSGFIPGGGSEQPIVEEEGEVRFSLPGRPVFEGIDPNAFLKPALVWQLYSEQAGENPIELSYITEGMSWEATYNLVAPAEGSDEFDFSGWISLRNDTGKTFEDADLKLIAGDVEKIRRVQYYRERRETFGGDFPRSVASDMPVERSFDEFHLYTLPRPVLLRNNELKQVEFVRAPGVKGNRYYVYNPTVGVPSSNNRNSQGADYGITTDKRVGVRVEISNSETNQLGVPLPKGRLRMYRTDDSDGRREFTGENEMEHLPKNELLKLDMGYAFDLVGERVQKDFSIDTTIKQMSESFEIKLRNRKEAPIEIRVIESLYRTMNWRIVAKNLPFEKIDSRTIEFRVPVPADGETVVTYTVKYTW